VYEAAAEAVARARRGDGPTLIECKTYRFEEHEIGLVVPGKPYRSNEEIEYHKANRDPIALYRVVLLRAGVGAAELDAIESEAAAAVREAIRYGEDAPLPDPSTLYDYMYSDPILYPPNAAQAS
jgi:TPP-dependent pyruvate/acetoin dehydrogenase alpha subunit